jgi:hypothetical protein
MCRTPCSLPYRVPVIRDGVIAAGRAAIHGYGAATGRWRPDPEFLIIGAKRGGSTSVYFDLLRHSRVCPLFPRPDHLPKTTATKGIHYFDTNYDRGERWYRAHLPSTFARARQARRAGGPVITGEGSPYYLFHPAAAERAALLLPDAKIIAVLRDPVDRAHSHWKERRRNGVEELSFADALAAEDDRIGDVDERLRNDPAFHSYAHEQLSYARQGEYDTALERWYAHYPAEQVKVLASEDYYADPQATLDELVGFLGLPAELIASGEVRNAAAGDDLDPAVRNALAARFAPHNARLEELTGRRFAWT